LLALSAPAVVPKEKADGVSPQAPDAQNDTGVFVVETTVFSEKLEIGDLLASATPAVVPKEKEDVFAPTPTVKALRVGGAFVGSRTDGVDTTDSFAAQLVETVSVVSPSDWVAPLAPPDTPKEKVSLPNGNAPNTLGVFSLGFPNTLVVVWKELEKGDRLAPPPNTDG
jgi:hypothetical protein